MMLYSIMFVGDDSLKHILFCGDQLTIERARGCQEARVNSDTMQEALLGLEPAIADWHAEANFLEVWLQNTICLPGGWSFYTLPYIICKTQGKILLFVLTLQTVLCT